MTKLGEGVHRYIFIGTIHPERAHLPERISKLKFSVDGNKGLWECNISIICNQVLIDVDMDTHFDLLFLKGCIYSMVNDELARISFLLGHDYTLSITRCVSRELGIDYVFGIDNEVVKDYMFYLDFELYEKKIKKLSIGFSGHLFRRALSDLKSVLSHRDDAGFYCFRAVETLRNYHAMITGCQDKKKAWEAFNSAIGVTKEEINECIKRHADGSRHGNPNYISNDDYKIALLKTWEIFVKYINYATK